MSAAAFSFWGNRSWTFAFTGNWVSNTARFVGAQCSGYGLTLLLLLTFHDRLHWPVEIVRATARRYKRKSWLPNCAELSKLWVCCGHTTNCRSYGTQFYIHESQKRVALRTHRALRIGGGLPA
ncbi:GtrA family protein [Paraburkholderia graminis]|uniref:GtrA family protein n=1 Tax=Paraburkholderia graminis TaxID=60548 RepID=UPI0009DBC222